MPTSLPNALCLSPWVHLPKKKAGLRFPWNPLHTFYVLSSSNSAKLPPTGWDSFAQLGQHNSVQGDITQVSLVAVQPNHLQLLTWRTLTPPSEGHWARTQSAVGTRTDATRREQLGPAPHSFTGKALTSLFVPLPHFFSDSLVWETKTWLWCLFLIPGLEHITHDCRQTGAGTQVLQGSGTSKVTMQWGWVSYKKNKMPEFALMFATDLKDTLPSSPSPSGESLFDSLATSSLKQKWLLQLAVGAQRDWPICQTAAEWLFLRGSVCWDTSENLSKSSQSLPMLLPFPILYQWLASSFAVSVHSVVFF